MFRPDSLVESAAAKNCTNIRFLVTNLTEPTGVSGVNASLIIFRLIKGDFIFCLTHSCEKEKSFSHLFVKGYSLVLLFVSN